MRRFTSLANWTPKRAHTFALRRIAKIEVLLEDIARVYDDVDQGVDSICTELREGQLRQVREAIDEALAEGRSI